MTYNGMLKVHIDSATPGGKMSDTKNQKIYLKDYQSPEYQIDKVELFFDLDEEFSFLTNHMWIQKTKPESHSLILDGEKLELVSVELNGQKLSAEQYIQSNETLTLLNTPSQFELKMITRLKPQENLSLEGLYKSNGVFCTQCEAQSFRHMTYFMDRPDVMTSFTVTIRADQTLYPILLSNGDRIREEKLENNKHQVTWLDPHKKPCYLFALVAGDLGVLKDTYTTQSGKKVSLEIYSKHGSQDRCGHAMESLKKSMRWDEETYGLEYDLSTYMILAVDDFNAGAMENKGLNIFNSRLIFANPESATDQDYHNIESVVAHEYFHNWSGNRITLRDWFHLSLKEGLTVYRDQEFSSDVGSRAVQRIQDVERLREVQFMEDSGPNAHPVRPDSCMSVDNFFTATIYEKGAEVIRMIETIIGKKDFNKGLRHYFKKHDGQAVTIEDFVLCFEETCDINLAQFRMWYNQARTPVLKITDHYDSAKKTYTFKVDVQTDHSMLIPLRIGLINQNGQDILKEQSQTLLIRNKQEVFHFENIQEQPIPSINRSFGAPIHYEYNYSIETLLHLLKYDSDGFNQWESSQKLGLLFLNELISNENFELPQTYLEAIRDILTNSKIDSALKAQLITLPSDSYLTQMQSTLKPQAFLTARMKIEESIVLYCRKELESIYQQIALNPGDRSLKNLALSLLSQIDIQFLEKAYTQFLKSQNMTDTVASLKTLVDQNTQHTQKALNHFLEKWKNEAVVLNHWFKIQALSRHPEAFSRIRELVKHPQFNINNPNNVYALLRSYSAVNLTAFHQPESHQFFAQKIIEIDAKNPQVAARLASSFDTWKKLEPELKASAHKAIQMCLENKLSKNTFEILSKSFQQ